MKMNYQFFPVTYDLVGLSYYSVNLDHDYTREALALIEQIKERHGLKDRQIRYFGDIKEGKKTTQQSLLILENLLEGGRKYMREVYDYNWTDDVS